MDSVIRNFGYAKSWLFTKQSSFSQIKLNFAPKAVVGFMKDGGDFTESSLLRLNNFAGLTPYRVLIDTDANVFSPPSCLQD